jgi:Elongation factor P, C-terminal
MTVDNDTLPPFCPEAERGVLDCCPLNTGKTAIALNAGVNSRWFIKGNEEYRAVFLEGKPLDVVLPPQVTLRVIETVPAQKGGSDSNWKPARLEGGLEIMVPLFIETGDSVRVETSGRKYLGKESGVKR